MIRYMTNSCKSGEKVEIMNQQEIIRRIKIIKVTNKINNQFIAECLGMKNARSVCNFLHGDYNLSDEKRRKAEKLISDLWVEL